MTALAGKAVSRGPTARVRRWLGVGAVVGGVVYAVAGGLIAGRNLGWLAGSPANAALMWLGVGLAMIVLAFALVHGDDIWRASAAGRVAAVSGVAAPLILLVSRLVEFAIFGTFTTFIAVAAFAVMTHRGRRLPAPDVVLLYVAAVASVTWNTETPSAALLIVVGFVGSWVSYRALLAGHWYARAGR